MAMKRPYGGEQPYIKVGMFKVRIPFIHCNPTFPEAIQGMCNGVLCFGAIATIMLCTGVSEEAAYGAAFLSTFLYIINSLAGDPTVCGWIMPAVPLVVSFCQGFPAGQQVQAMAALQLMLAAIFLFLGGTGLAKKVITFVPPSIKGGIVLGAAIASIFGEYKTGGRVGTYPITIMVSTVAMIFLLYSPVFKGWVKKGNPVAKILASLGLVPAVILAMILAAFTGESPMEFSVFPIITLPNFATMYRELSPFSVGFPSPAILISAIPTAFAIYIVAFGDTLVLKEIVRNGTETRKDEYCELNVNRVSITAGLRNLILGFICPFGPLASPLGAAFTISMLQGYEDRGEKGFYSIHGGAMSGNYMPFITMIFTPIVSLVRPIAPICMSLCLVSQGFTCTASGIGLCREKTDLAIAGAIAAVMVARGAAWGFAVGIVCYIFIASRDKRRDDLAYNRSIIAAEDEEERKAAELMEKERGEAA